MSEKSPKEVPKELTKRLRLDSDEYVLRKRIPNHLPKRDNDIYVNTNTNFGVQMKKCQNLLDNKQIDEIVIHGLGKAVNRAINMGLQLKQNYDLETSCNTSSVELLDDFEPIGHNREVNDSHTQRRIVSAIQIKLFRKTNDKTLN